MQEAQFPKATILYGGVKGVLNRWCRILLIYRLAALKTPVRVRWWGETPMMVRWQGHTWMMVIKPPPHDTNKILSVFLLRNGSLTAAP